jgi:carbamoylphosphate synthase small subunit
LSAFADQGCLYRKKSDVIFENLILRQQLGMYLVKKQKPDISDIDRSMLVAIMRVFSKWRNSLIAVKPETLISWQRETVQNILEKNFKKEQSGKKKDKQGNHKSHKADGR